jgi:transposase
MERGRFVWPQASNGTVALTRAQLSMERGRFIWPQAASGTVALTRAQLSMLLEGIDWRQPQRTWEPQLAG